MRLAASGGTICEDGGIVAVEHVVQQRPGGALVHIALGGILVKDTVEGEGLVLGLLVVLDDRAGEAVDGVALGRVEDSLALVVSIADRSTNERAQGLAVLTSSGRR